ncbi:MAG: WYL domain-containing protein [Thermoanaerobacteraceae bacterium]|nr:WYL domain-containing protein [Thermoanaerobacteraceae bacterium]
MPGDLEEIERQLMLITMLSQEKEGLTADEIKNRFLRMGIDLNIRTIKRDMDTLSEAYLPVYEEEEGRKTRYFIDKYTLKDVTFTVSEVLGLYFLKELIEPIKNVELADDAYALIDRMIVSVPPISRSYIDQIKDTFKVDSGYLIPDEETDMKLLDDLQDAARVKRSVEMVYYSYSSNNTGRRIVDPYVVYFRDGNYYLVGYCHSDNDIREFKLTRIKELKRTENAFEYIEGFDFDEYRKYSFNRLRGDGHYMVKVRFTGEAARLVKEFDRYRADKIEDMGSGDILFIKEVSTLDEIKRWVLGYGKDAFVLEPEELVKEIKDDVDCLREQYSKV